MYIFKFWVLGTALIVLGCVFGATDSSCGICNRGRNISKAAGSLYNRLPKLWPGKQAWNTRCREVKDLIKNVSDGKKHSGVISYMEQYVKLLEEVYNQTQRTAETLYTSCTPKEDIRKTIVQMYAEHLNWSDSRSTDYNISLNVSTVETTEARSMLEVIERFGNCLRKTKNDSHVAKCADRVFKKCGRGRKERKRKDGTRRKGRRQNRKRKGSRNSKSRKRN